MKPEKRPWYISSPFRIIPDYSRKVDRMAICICAIMFMGLSVFLFFVIFRVWCLMIKVAERLVSLAEAVEVMSQQRLVGIIDEIVLKIVRSYTLFSRIILKENLGNWVHWGIAVLLLFVFVIRKKTAKEWKIFSSIMVASAGVCVLFQYISHLLILEGFKMPLETIFLRDNWITWVFVLQAGQDLILITWAVLIFRNSCLLWKNASERVQYRGFLGHGGFLCWKEDKTQVVSHQ